MLAFLLVTFLLGFAIGVVIGMVYYHFHKPVEFSKDEEKAIDDIVNSAVNSVVMLCGYKIPKKVIEYYNEDYPYLVVAEKPNSTEVEFWWAGDKDVKDLQHSCIADKYVQLGHCVICNAVKEEAHG